VPELRVGETVIDYTLRRSETVKSARITVTPDAVDVVVPATATDDQIAAVLNRRRAWLVEQLSDLRERARAIPTIHRFVSGAKIPYRGRMAKLIVEEADVDLVAVTYRHGFHVRRPRGLKPDVADRMVESALRLWLRKRLRQDAAEIVKRLGVPNGLKPKAIHVKEQEHLWGSCGTDRIVNLNWHLIFAPKTVLEYAVVHEICHLKHRNHGPEFWGLVGRILPDWEQRKRWLEVNAHMLGYAQLT
jgi:predicted metal-dependent hydrolase